MAVSQATYPTTMPIGLPGQSASMVNHNEVTKLCDTVAGIGFGLAVTRNAANKNKGVVLGGALAGFIGISLVDVAVMVADKYSQHENMAVKTTGDIFALAKEAVAAGDPVYYDTATGEFWMSADASRQGPVPSAQWTLGAGSGGVGIITLGIQKG
jgi:hypothetical protein